MTYVDASALLRILFAEPGPTVPLTGADRVVSSRLVEVEAGRAIDRERLLGQLDDRQTALKRKELADVLAILDLAAVDEAVIARAKDPFAVTVRALDALHVATAELLAAEAAGEPLLFWTHDDRQGAAALSRGLTVRGVQIDGTAPVPPEPPPRERRGGTPDAAIQALGILGTPPARDS